MNDSNQDRAAVELSVVVLSGIDNSLFIMEYVSILG